MTGQNGLVESGIPLRTSFSDRWVQRRNVGFGPFRYAGPAGWLLVASLLRVMAYGGAPVLGLLATIPILLAFIDATQKAIEGFGGRTALAEFSLTELLKLAKRTARSLLPCIFIPLVIFVPLLKALGIDSSVLVGAAAVSIDGIAFDTGGPLAPLVNAVFALLIFLMIVAHGTGRDASLRYASLEFMERSRQLFPALVASFLLLLTLSGLQDLVRPPIYRLIIGLGLETLAGKLLFFLFVVGFAAIRLTLLVSIFAIALRGSYRGKH